MSTASRSALVARDALSADLTASLASALAWAIATRARLGTGASFVGTLGATALTLGILVVVARRARPVSDTSRTVLGGALLSSGPLALLGAALQTNTHHRALGAVTYSIAALSVLSLAALLVRRMTRNARSPRARLLLYALQGASAALFVGSLANAPGLRSSHDLVVDFVIGCAATLLGLAVPRVSIPRRLARAGVVIWCATVATGFFVLDVRGAVRTDLETRAPLAAGAAHLLPEARGQW